MPFLVNMWLKSSKLHYWLLENGESDSKIHVKRYHCKRNLGPLYNFPKLIFFGTLAENFMKSQVFTGLPLMSKTSIILQGTLLLWASFFFLTWNSQSPAVKVMFQRPGRYYRFFFAKKRSLPLGKVWILDYCIFCFQLLIILCPKSGWLILLLMCVQYKYWKIIDPTFLLMSQLCVTNNTNEAKGLIQVYIDAKDKRACLWSISLVA